ncbi:hypothetical protein [Moorena producens]|uniref:hypothetical protein n=1 Tax=Moorena producens TaxID=1155739 RepID=UPI003C7466FC
MKSLSSIIPDSLLPIPYSRFPIPDSRFPIPDSLLPTPYSLLPFLYVLKKIPNCFITAAVDYDWGFAALCWSRGFTSLD